ncbi:MAG: hypothetical protein HFH60_09600 [Lachnospiraceae bacterium]|nr:hypothetical protein [Lachnospiraceae bacterium]
MTNDEKLDLILSEIRDMKTDMKDMKAYMQNMDLRIQNLESDIQSMKTDIQNLKTDIQNLKMDSQNLKTDIQNLKTDMNTLKLKVTGIELKLEEEIRHNIQLLAENHSNLIDKLNQAIRVTDKTLIWEVQLSGFRVRLEKLEEEFAELRNRL